ALARAHQHAAAGGTGHSHRRVTEGLVGLAGIHATPPGARGPRAEGGGTVAALLLARPGVCETAGPAHTAGADLRHAPDGCARVAGGRTVHGFLPSELRRRPCAYGAARPGRHPAAAAQRTAPIELILSLPNGHVG